MIIIKEKRVPRDDNYKEKRVSNSEVVSGSNMTIQLRFDVLTCCVFANIVQASANSSHVNFLLGTTAVRYSLLPI